MWCDVFVSHVFRCYSAHGSIQPASATITHSRCLYTKTDHTHDDHIRLEDMDRLLNVESLIWHTLEIGLTETVFEKSLYVCVFISLNVYQGNMKESKCIV